MKTLRMLTAGMLLAATAGIAAAGEEPNVPTITVTAKRHEGVPATERVAPRATVAVPVIMPTDMPEAEIDFHLPPFGATPPAPAVERAKS